MTQPSSKRTSQPDPVSQRQIALAKLIIRANQELDRQRPQPLDIIQPEAVQEPDDESG